MVLLLLLKAAASVIFLLKQLLNIAVFQQQSLLQNVWSATRVSPPPPAHAVKEKRNDLALLPTTSISGQRTPKKCIEQDPSVCCHVC